MARFQVVSRPPPVKPGKGPGKWDVLPVVHGLFDSRERAERHIAEVIPVYIERGYFDDKTLQAGDFFIVDNHAPRC